MLLPAEFSVAYIGDATAGLTLILPRDHYDEPILVTCASGSPYAIFLGQNQFAGFECTNNNSFGGILIPNVSIEINEDSIFDAENRQPPLGALVRRGTQIDLITRTESGFRRPIKTPLIVGLPPCSQTMAAGFTKWQIFIGEGIMKRELRRIEIGD